jgi:hypothetical protein
MGGLKFLPFVLLAGLLWFLFVSEQGSIWLAQKITARHSTGPVVGKLVSAEGSFKRVNHGGVEVLRGPLVSPLELHDGDRLEADRGAKLILLLNSQDELEMVELSAVSLHLWNVNDASSPVYIQWFNGEVNALKKGVRGKAYFIREGRLYFPGQKPMDKPLALTVLRAAPVDMQLADQGSSASEDSDFAPDDKDNAEELPTDVAKFGSSPETLSNEYIDEMIVSRQGQLQKCWLSRLKDNPHLKGQMVLQFEITRRGKVRELRVADSNLDDEVLKRCVMTVVERIPFRAYKGQEITLSYPITFE